MKKLLLLDKIMVSREVMPYSLLDMYQNFVGTSCLHLHSKSHISKVDDDNIFLCENQSFLGQVKFSVLVTSV
jgi:hypothetical protein